MDAQTYFEMIQRTATHPDPELDKLAKFHWSEGLLGEQAELIIEDLKRNKEGVEEEGGDVLWYLGNKCREQGVDFVMVMNRVQQKGVTYAVSNEGWAKSMSRGEQLSVALGFFMERVKRRNFYQNKVVAQNELNGLLLGVLCSLKRYFLRYELTFAEVMQANIDKLAERYPQEFNG